MGNFRFKHGVARGPVGNFQARSDNVFSSTDTTPDVTLGNLFYTNNASATAITHFDISGQNAISENWGKEIKVILLDGNTTLTPGNQLRLKDGQSVAPAAGAAFEFVYANSVWYETYRSYNTASVLNIESGGVGAGGVITINPAVTAVTLLTGASSSMTLERMPGGYTGQQVSLIGIGSSITLLTNSAGAADTFVVKTVAGTSAIITGSFGMVFQRVVQGATAKWIQLAED